MAERDQETALELLRQGATDRRIGLLGALALAFTGLLVSCILIILDKSLEGFGVFLLSLASLVGTAAYRITHPHKPAQNRQNNQPT